jgi:hypothetical protein
MLTLARAAETTSCFLWSDSHSLASPVCTVQVCDSVSLHFRVRGCDQVVGRVRGAAHRPQILVHEGHAAGSGRANVRVSTRSRALRLDERMPLLHRSSRQIVGHTLMTPQSRSLVKCLFDRVIDIISTTSVDPETSQAGVAFVGNVCSNAVLTQAYASSLAALRAVSGLMWRPLRVVNDGSCRSRVWGGAARTRKKRVA